MLWKEDAIIVFNLFFRPRHFVDLATEEVLKMNPEEVRKRAVLKPEVRELQASNTYKVRKSIWESSLYVLEAFLIAFFLALFTKSFYPSLSSHLLSWIRIVSAFLILWAVMGKVGWEIQTIGGKSLPEKANNLWFRFLYTGGVTLLFFTIFYEFIIR